MAVLCLSLPAARSKHQIGREWGIFDTDGEQYAGQAAYISSNKGAFSNPFFNSVPPGMFYPSLVISILAAIVASQTMITATFQLLSQIIKLSYFPQIRVVHTSKIFHGQIYIPWVNWLLMVGTIVVTAAYNNVSHFLSIEQTLLFVGVRCLLQSYSTYADWYFLDHQIR